jgi:hypothetical protein
MGGGGSWLQNSSIASSTWSTLSSRWARLTPRFPLLRLQVGQEVQARVGQGDLGDSLLPLAVTVVGAEVGGQGGKVDSDHQLALHPGLRQRWARVA